MCLWPLWPLFPAHRKVRASLWVQLFYFALLGTTFLDLPLIMACCISSGPLWSTRASHCFSTVDIFRVELCSPSPTHMLKLWHPMWSQKSFSFVFLMFLQWWVLKLGKSSTTKQYSQHHPPLFLRQSLTKFLRLVLYLLSSLGWPWICDLPLPTSWGLVQRLFQRGNLGSLNS